MEITPRGDSSGALAAFGILAGPHSGDRIPVRLPVVRIGRGSGNDIVIPDDSVSASHARLEFDEGAWRITDLESVNGTYVEEVRLAPQVPTPLPYGAAVRLGGVRLEFAGVEEANPEAARAEYVAPAPEPTIRERTGRRFPVWLLLVILVLIVLAVLLFTTFYPVQAQQAALPVQAVGPGLPAPPPAAP